MSFRKKIFFAVLAGALLATSVPLLYVRLSLHDIFLAEAEKRALREVLLAARLYTTMGADNTARNYVESLATQEMRFSLLATCGKLIDDSDSPESNIPSATRFGDRPEIRAAQKYGQGTASRFHKIKQTHMIYAAIRLDNNQILRVAMPFSGVASSMNSVLKGFLIIIISAIALALVLALFIASLLKHNLSHMIRVLEAISMGQYQRRLRYLPCKEFMPLGHAVNHMAQHIEKHIHTIADQKEQLQSILDTMNEGVLVFDTNGGIRRCNKALRTMFPGIAQIGQQVVEVIPVPALQKAVEEVLLMPHMPYKEKHMGPLQLELAPGRTFAVQLTRASTNQLDLGAVAVFHDITALIRLERVRSDFVANVSHELRTPLTAIQGYAETLVALDNMPPSCRRFAEIIQKNGTYLARMLEELLALARLENTDMPVQVSAIRIQESITNAVNLCRHLFDCRHIRITVEVYEGTLVMANTQLITQVFRNLLENAGRYAPKGGYIHIQANQDMHAGMLTCAVCDDGQGIPSAEHQRIFERFYRVEKHRGHANHTMTAKRAPKNLAGPTTGLGLAICKHTVERFGGRIWVESPSKEHATAFYFTLPLALGEKQ